ncbi:Uncharacterized protein HZ326_27876 [Fusarium oxysporum f. sp. albedinis]|nr:Uncharacterized protein HZ326_27876 [Fusarium oxysporum f. sp. albedinis]
MDNMHQYQIIDSYLLSIISLSFFLFIYLKFDAAWSKNTCLVALAIVWIILELLALILFSLQMSGVVKDSWSPQGTMYAILITLSLWGIGTLQFVRFYIYFSLSRPDWAYYIPLSFQCPVSYPYSGHCTAPALARNSRLRKPFQRRSLTPEIALLRSVNGRSLGCRKSHCYTSKRWMMYDKQHLMTKESHLNISRT